MSNLKWISRNSIFSQRQSRLMIPLIGLLAVLMIGVVADAALLLERYATLTAALDSAAIAAAREIRAGQPDALTSATSLARQLIELRGLEVITVRVETCDTSETLCASTESRKRVQVTAEVSSNTVLFRFAGLDVVTLSASSTSEIAALDLVILIDVSESMLDTTTPEAWAQIGMGQVYIPPKWENLLESSPVEGDEPHREFPRRDLPRRASLWHDWLTAPPQTVSERLVYDNQNDPYAVRSFPFPGYEARPQHPRPECRVQFYPYSIATEVPTHLQRLAEFRNVWGTTDNQWQGFVPAYDYFGCCNDPTHGGKLDADGRLVPVQEGGTVDFSAGDFDFSDLICTPFRETREVVRQLVEQVDFEGGDRVAFVTFDRTAFIIDPDGANGGDVTLCEDEATNLDLETGKTRITPMMTCRERALDTLQRHIGVRAEPTFYRWNEDGGGWTGFVRDEQDYPVRGNCTFQNAALPNFFSLYSLWDWGEIAMENGLDPFAYYPLSDHGGLYRIMNPNPFSEAWDARLTAQQSYELWASCRGSNIGAALREGFNVLANARRENTLWAMVVVSDGGAGASDPVRINGRKPTPADPYAELDTPAMYPPDSENAIIRYGIGGEYGAFGLCPIGTAQNPTELTRTNRNAMRFPFCADLQPETRHFCAPPQGNAALVGTQCNRTDGLQAGFAPNSADLDYDCDLPFAENVSLGNVYDMDIGTGTDETCDPLYDVDDYARDWADFITQSAVQRPVIYAIAVGVDFPVGATGPGTVTNPGVPNPRNPRYVPGSPAQNPADYLGEELLRYLADVGDNFRVDTDYQQDWLDNQVLDFSADYGQRGACEDPDESPGTIAPLPPRTSCGGYFNAPTQQDIDRLYADLSSRLSIRLTASPVVER